MLPELPNDNLDLASTLRNLTGIIGAAPRCSSMRHLLLVLHTLQRLNEKLRKESDPDEGARDDDQINSMLVAKMGATQIEEFSAELNRARYERITWEAFRLARTLPDPERKAPEILPDPPHDGPKNPLPGFAAMLGGIAIPYRDGDPEFDRLLVRAFARATRARYWGAANVPDNEANAPDDTAPPLEELTRKVDRLSPTELLILTTLISAATNREAANPEAAPKRPHSSFEEIERVAVIVSKARQLLTDSENKEAGKDQTGDERKEQTSAKVISFPKSPGEALRSLAMGLRTFPGFHLPSKCEADPEYDSLIVQLMRQGQN
jgi:hypothetical protein